MLTFSRNDGESIIFHHGGKSVVLRCRIDDSLRLYYGYGNKLVLRLDDAGEFNCIKVLGQPVTVLLKKYRGYDTVQISIEAPRDVVIHRDDFFQGAQS